MSVVARSVSRRAVALPVAGALLLVLAAAPVLDEPGWAHTVLRGVALLLAVAAAAAVDEPEARLLDASPTSFARRVVRRLLVVAVVVLPTWLGASWWCTRSVGVDPVQAARELAVLVVVALAVSAGLRRWTALAEPAVLTGPLLVVGLLLSRRLLPFLPAGWLSPRETWAVALAAGLGGLGLGLRDPATAGRRRLPGARRS